MDSRRTGWLDLTVVSNTNKLCCRTCNVTQTKELTDKSLPKQHSHFLPLAILQKLQNPSFSKYDQWRWRIPLRCWWLVTYTTCSSAVRKWAKFVKKELALCSFRKKWWPNAILPSGKGSLRWYLGLVAVGSFFLSSSKTSRTSGESPASAKWSSLGNKLSFDKWLSISCLTTIKSYVFVRFHTLVMRENNDLGFLQY